MKPRKLLPRKLLTTRMLDDLDLKTLMEDEDEFLDFEVGVEEEDPAHETRATVATREKPGTPGVVHTDDRSRHERIASMTVGSRVATV